MWIIAIYSAFMLFVLAQSMRKVLPMLHFRREPRILPAEVPELPATERATRDAALAGLLGLGFVVELDGEYARSTPQGRPPAGRVWTTLLSHPSRTTYAMVTVNKTGGTDGVVETISVVTALRAKLPDGRRLTTTSSPARTAMPTPRGWIVVRAPDAPPGELWEAHQRALARVGPAAALDSILDEQHEVERESISCGLEAGSMVPLDEQHVRIDGVSFAQTMLVMMNPVTGEARHPAASAAMLVALLALGAATAHHFAHAGVALGAGFTVLVVATFALFPKTAAVTTIAVELSGVEAWWGSESDLPLLAAVLVGPPVGTFVARRIGSKPTSAERPWMNTLRLALLVAGIAVGGAAYVLMRAPRETGFPPGAMMVIGAFLLMSALFAPVTLLLALFPTVRGSVVFQLATLATLSLIPAELAFVTALAHSGRDEAASSERGRELIAAIRAHHDATGALPNALGDLVPARLASLPAPLVGWPGAAFDYAPDGTGAFRLSYRSASGRVGWNDRVGAFVPSWMFGSPGPVPVARAAASGPAAAASGAPVDPLDVP